MSQALKRAEEQGRPLGLLVFDLDEFKEINDTHGHGMGDALLIKLGERLRAQVRGIDLVARLGGDEFAVIMENLRSVEDMPLIAAKLIAAIKQPMTLRNTQFSLGVSCGVAVYPADGATQRQLVEKADRAMYRAKQMSSTAPEPAAAMLH